MPLENLKAIQEKWITRWDKAQCASAPSTPTKKKFYNRDAAPFPNGDLHIGHLRNYVLGDIMARYKRQSGYDVLYATNFDAFGLPNALAAMKLGITPAELTDKNIRKMTATFRALGISYDWARIKSTSDPGYYRWTQWLFLRMHEAGMVYRSEKKMAWCPSCEVTLAYMQILEGRCWRCGADITAKSVPQWFIRLSEATEELYESIDALAHWSERSKHLMRGFIGRSQGDQVSFPVANHGLSAHSLEVFLPEGMDIKRVRYVACAADGSGLLSLLQSADRNASLMSLERFDRSVAELTDTGFSKGVRRSGKNVETARCGFDAGLRLVIPWLNAEIPVWVVNYLSTEAGPPVKACAPDCDPGEKIFAEKYGIGDPKRRATSKQESTVELRQTPKVYYQVHDWAVSRGKKWGTPVPFIHCPECGLVPAPEENLPITLDEQASAEVGNSDGRSIPCFQCGSPSHYDPDTLDVAFDDCWCFSTGPYTDVETNPFLDEETQAWLPVDWYHSGFDIYTITHIHRFAGWFLFKQGLLKCREGLEGYHGHDLVLGAEGKISKRYGNEGDLSSLLEEYGADVLRIAIAWAANPGKQIHWTGSLLTAAQKLLNRLSAMTDKIIAMEAGDSVGRSGTRVLSDRQWERFHASLTSDIHRVSNFISTYRPNAAISIIDRRLSMLRRLMAKSSQAESVDRKDVAHMKRSFKRIIQVLSPFAPFHCEEVWEMLGAPPFVATSPWPASEECESSGPVFSGNPQ